MPIRDDGRTRAIVPVHFAGRPCEMDELMSLARQHELKVIEDCAHAIETQYHGRSVGTIGDFGCFSFYVTKNIVTGEGGMVLARREEDAARVKVLGLHGMSKDAWKRFGDEGYKHYYVVEAGFKYNMMDLQAAIGLKQLARIEPYWQRRKSIWERYVDELADLPLELKFDHLLFLHNDDQLCPGALGLLANACVNQTDARVKLWFGTHLIMDEAGVVDPERSTASDRWYGRLGPGATRPVWEWCLTESIPSNAFLVERATYLQYMHGERDGNVGDWAFSLRLANSGGWAQFIAQAVSRYRVQGGSVASAVLDLGAALQEQELTAAPAC